MNIYQKRDEIKKLMEREMKVGENFYLISYKWFIRWKDRVLWKDENETNENEKEDENEEFYDNDKDVGKIDNSHLIEDHLLKKGTQEFVDFILVSEDVYKLLSSW